jgi:LuxR family maltose regulon positive regulatory protein
MVATGLSNHDIAERLYLSVGTVKRHLHNILGKLDADSRVAAIARARQYGVLN